MRREFHVRFCEGVGVRFPRATRLVILCRSQAEAEQALRETQDWTAKAGLKLHPEKTRVVDATQNGGRPSEAGLQEQASNSRKLRWSRAIVVNVTEKGVTNHIM